MNYTVYLEEFGLYQNRYGELVVENRELLPRVRYYSSLDQIEIRYPISGHIGLGKIVRIDYTDLYIYVKNWKQDIDSLLKILWIKHYFVGEGNGSGKESIKFSENDWYVGGNAMYDDTLDLIHFTCLVFNLNATFLKEVKRKRRNGTKNLVLNVKKFALGGEGARVLGDGTVVHIGRGGARMAGSVGAGEKKLPYGYQSIDEIYGDLVFDAFYGVADFEDQYRLWCKVRGVRFNSRECWEKFDEIKSKARQK